MKRLAFYAVLSLLSLFVFIPIASAFPGDCYSTCDIEADCSTSTQSCSECTRQYSETECLEWQETTCKAVGACGQCTILSEWTQKSTGSWQFSKAYCWTDPNPDVVIEQWLRPHYIDTYQRQRCKGVEQVVMVARRQDYWDSCSRKATRACTTADPRSPYGTFFNCPF